MSNEIFFIIIILLQLIIGLLTAYLTNYVNQKGKNWADKEDMKELTETVEEVKQKFQKDNEFLKAELNLLTNRKSQVFSEEKESIILFFTSLNEWLWSKCNIPIFDYNSSNYNDLNEKIIALKNQHHQVNVLFSKVQLLVDNQKLIEVGYHAISETLNLHQFVIENCSNLKKSLAMEKSMFDTIFSKEFDYQKAPNEIKDFMMGQAKDNQKDKENITNEYLDKQLVLFKKAMSFRHQFKDLAKEHLKS